MAIGSVLALVDGGNGSKSALETAIAIGKAFSAYVEVLHISRAAPPSGAIFADGASVAATNEIVEALAAQSHKRAERAKALFDRHCVEAGCRVVEIGSDRILEPNETVFAWNLVAGPDNLELAERGRLFDLIVMAKADERDGGVDSTFLEAALFDTGRPVMIACEHQPRFTGGRVAIAWDGSREAAHSVGMAVPILEAAGQVCVMTVSEDSGAEIGERLARYLARHGVECRFASLEPNGAGVAGALLRGSQDNAIDLIVMGAYGHSPLGEYLFGGVTRDMLTAGSVPLLMAH